MKGRGVYTGNHEGRMMKSVSMDGAEGEKIMPLGNHIAGRTRKSQFDFYETPEWATEKFLSQAIADGTISKNDKVYECCCGAGAIVRVLQKMGFEKIAQSDIQTEDYISGEKGVDVYSLKDNCCEIVITNPPYNLMTKENMLCEFLRIASKKVILLLNIYFISSAKRKEMLENSPLKTVYIHSDRVTMFPHGEETPKNGGTKLFAWFVWEHGYTGTPEIKLI